MKMREIQAKTILSKSRLPGCDYVINPYTGCQHGCRYCYAIFMKKYGGHDEGWGKFVDVKLNAAGLLKREIKKIRRGSILLSSVTDPYQPLEKRYRITREILKVLSHYDFDVSILTKSDLILRDTDTIKKFKNINVGLSFFSLDEIDVRNFEPASSPVERRLEALKVLKASRIRNYAFISPIMPFITDIPEFFHTLSSLGVDEIWFENFNHRAGTWDDVLGTIREKYPDFSGEYKRIFLTQHHATYWSGVRKQIKRLSERYGIPVRIYFHRWLKLY